MLFPSHCDKVKVASAYETATPFRDERRIMRSRGSWRKGSGMSCGFENEIIWIAGFGKGLAAASFVKERMSRQIKRAALTEIKAKSKQRWTVPAICLIARAHSLLNRPALRYRRPCVPCSDSVAILLPGAEFGVLRTGYIGPS